MTSRAATRTLRIIIVTVIMIAAAEGLRAQNVIGRGVEIGVSYGGASGTSIFPNPTTGIVQNHEATQRTWGLHAGIIFPDLIGDLGIVTRIAYSSSVASHIRHIEWHSMLIPSPDPDEGGTIIQEKTNRIYEIQSWRVEAEGLARYSVVGGFSLQAGASVGFRQVTAWEERDSVIWPGNARLVNPDPARYAERSNGRVLVLPHDDLPGENHLALAGIIGLAYTFLPLDNFTVTPELRLRYDIIEPGNLGTWRPMSIEAMISIGVNEIVEVGTDE